jgi:DNA invertase Pin-like site-specific DNA recombinase
MFIGYVRSSPAEPDLAPQIEALKAAQCEPIFIDERVNAAATSRPALDRAMATLKRGDVLVVWKLDRLGRSLSHLIQTTKLLADREIGFRSVSEGIDTTSIAGEHFVEIVSALDEFERALVIERTRAGASEAKQRGTKAGRKPKLSTEQIDHARRLLDAGEGPREVARTLGVGLATLYRKIPAAASNRDTRDLFTGLAT